MSAIPLPGTASWDPINVDDVNRLRDAGLIPKNIKEAMRVWDDWFTPVTEIIMPAIASPGNQRSFSWPIMADAGGMAPRAEVPGNPEHYTFVVKEESFKGAITNAGYDMQPVIGGIEFPRLEATKAQYITKMINRRIEFDCLRYAAMEPIIIGEFSTQVPGRRGLVFNITAGTPAWAGLVGAPWDDYLTLGAAFASNPLLDIDTAALSIKQMTGEKASYLFVGPNTWTALVNHPVILNLLMYTEDNLVDTGANIARIHGITVKEVTNFYKEQQNATLFRNAPGRGTYQEDTWATRNKVEFMRDFATGNTEEFALMTTDKIGGRFYFTTDKEHSNGAQPFVWSEMGFDRIKKVAMQKGYGIFVEDFGKVRRLDRVATIRF